MSITVTEFLRLAMSEIGVARAGDVVEPEAQNDALAIFNELLDGLNLERAIYNRAFTTYTITPALQPHTIGPAASTPTFTVTTGRPDRIRAANLILTGTIRRPITLRDAAWWNKVAAPAITSADPTDLYYRRGWPLGSIYLWPVPTTAWGLELETDTLLAQVAETDTLDLPFGYQAALRLTLAELLAPHFGVPLAGSTSYKAREARALAWSANDEIPDAVTRDAGLPGGHGGSFDFRTGFIGR